MTEHIPWCAESIGLDDLYDIYDSGDRRIAINVKLDDARRIVDCVNACEGINPEAVPELLAELIKLRKRFHNACIATGSDPEYAEGSTPGADAAIAKATGDAA